MSEKEYYVYITYDKKDFSIKYVGSGSGDRYRHVLSGRSSSIKANKAVLNNTGEYVTEIFIPHTDKKYINELEKCMIHALQPEWNSQHYYKWGELNYRTLFDAMRVKAYLILQTELYTPKYFENFKDGMLFTFLRFEDEALNPKFMALYDKCDVMVKYYLENGDWEFKWII